LLVFATIEEDMHVHLMHIYICLSNMHSIVGQPNKNRFQQSEVPSE
jgi:hypothetical protein